MTYQKIDWMKQAEAMYDQLVDWRRDFHMHPELGFEEHRTAGIVAAELERLGYQVQTGVATTGVVGLLETGRPGPVVLLRFDMDALPLQEENQVPYKSQVADKMHACGHDAHVAIGLGVANLLIKHQDQLGGTVKLMFQPGEEGMNGAEVMVKEGVLENPRPDVALAAHVWNDEPLGQVSVVAGPVMAAAESWECHIKGKGGHGAAPHQAYDPVVTAAQVILAWQTVVSRNVDPKETAVFSVGSIHAGDAFNIIPEAATMGGTIRSFDAQVRQTVLERVEQIAVGVSSAMGCTAELTLNPLCPAVVNDPTVTAKVRNVVEKVVGEENILETRTMGSEDMAFVNAEIPGCYLFVGSSNEEAGLNFPHHNPRFDIDERVLPLSVGLLLTCAAEYLQA